LKNDSRFKDLLKELSRDPRVKRALARDQLRGKSGRRIERASEITLLISAIASRFVPKKKARAIEEFADIVNLLIRVSLLLKENVLDRPGVREFLDQRSKEAYLLVERCVAMLLPDKKKPSRIHKSRR
jgi:hypothetical protein